MQYLQLCITLVFLQQSLASIRDTDLKWTFYLIFISVYVVSIAIQMINRKSIILTAQIAKVVLFWLCWNEVQFINQLWLTVIFEMQFIYSQYFSDVERFSFLSMISILYNFQTQNNVQIISVLLTVTNLGLFLFWHTFSQRKSIGAQYPWLYGEKAFILNQKLEVIYDYRTDRKESIIIDMMLQQYLLALTSKFGCHSGHSIIKDHNLFILYGLSKDFAYKSSKSNDSQESQFEDFCKSISHELSTCLNGMLTLSYIAVTDQAISIETKQNYFHPILKNSQQLQLIVNNLKDFNDIKCNNFMFEIQQFNIINETQVIINFFDLALQEKHIEIKTNQMILNPIIFNDKNRYKQILYQILSNAIRYSKQGVIIIKFKIKQSYIQISVEDQGIGMIDEEQHQLQMIIDQGKLHRVSKQSVGCGLGICISSVILLELSQPQSKKLQFTSKQGIGTTFKFWISHNSDDQGSSQMLHSIKSPSQTRVKILYNNYSYVDIQFSNLKSRPIHDSLKKISIQPRFLSVEGILRRPQESAYVYDNIDDSGDSLYVQIPPIFLQMNIEIDISARCCSKILIVDDECFNIYVMEKILNHITTTFDRAFNGEEAIQRVLQKKSCQVCSNKCYSLILLDVNMPIKDGIDTMREISELQKSKSIRKPICIGNSAFSDLATKQACFGAGMDYYITKPIDVALFRELIMNIFQIR